MTIQKLELDHITKRFSNITANQDISIEINAGEIVALLGENGAGKTTLMNVLFGIVRPESGLILINNKPVTITNPSIASQYGIGMIHQHFMLIQTHTVVENIALGMQNVPFFLPEKKVKKKIVSFTNQYGFSLNPDAKIWQLSAGEQQRVEIVKVLMQGAQVLILDEPTSVLTPGEVKDLFHIIRKMKQEGKAIIFITHKLDEIMEISDRVIVLRRGKVVGEKKTNQTNVKELATMMVGKDILYQVKKDKVQSGKTLLEAKSVYIRDDRMLSSVNNLSFSIKEREIFGIAGVSGNGQRELIEGISGLRKIEKGTIFLEKVNITNQSAKHIYEMGISHIPEERIRYGVVSNLPISDNIVLKEYDKKPFSKKGLMNQTAIDCFSKKIVSEFNVFTPSVRSLAKNLSGGNIQKLILGREITGSSKFIIASHPTYGLDISSTQYIWEQLIQKRNEGSSILLVSEDLEEIFTLSDRIAVMYEGRFMGVVAFDSISKEDIGLMMAGSKQIPIECWS